MAAPTASAWARRRMPYSSTNSSGGGAGEDGAGDVGAVAVEGAAEVADDGLAGADDAVAGVVVGAGRVGPAADDGEVDDLVPGVDEPVADLARHLGLGAADEGDLAPDELGGDDVGGGRRPPEGVHLGVVLDRPQRADDGGGRKPLPAGEGVLEAEDEGGPGAVGYGQPLAVGPDQASDQGDRVVGLVPGPDPEQLGVGSDPWFLEEGDDKGGVALDRQDQHGQPLEGHRLVAGQPRQVGTDGQEQDVDTQVRHAGLRLRRSFREHRSRRHRPEATAHRAARRSPCRGGR